MKVCFFDRCNLVHLYGAIDNALCNKYDICHVAYDLIEYNQLVNKYHIPENRIVLFKEELKKYLTKDYTDFDYDDLDKRITEATDNRFNLNLSIQVDRALKYKSYEDSLRLFAALFSFWDDYFEKEKPDLIFHEMVSLAINHICAVVAKERNIVYVSEIQIPGLYDTNLLFANYWGGTPLFPNSNNEKIKESVAAFIENYKKKKQPVLFGNMFKTNSSIKFLFPAIKSAIRIKVYKKYYTDLEDYIDYYISNDSSIISKYRNLKKYSCIKWDSFDKTKNYYYFPFHLEPEAAVFFWGDGIYTNQIKLIENIAASLPPNTYLYVKDHPHDIGYRNPNDYIKLKQINNIKLLYAKESGYDVIKHSKGVITINGSAGFEALLLDKPVFCFGHPYYESFNNVRYIANIKDLRNELKKTIVIKSNLNNLIQLYSNTYEGNTAIFYGNQNYDTENLNTVINSFELYLKNIKEKQNA